MLLVETYVAPSAIHGQGLFAAKPIKAGEVVWRFDRSCEVTFTSEQVNKLAPMFRKFVLVYSFFDESRHMLVLSIDNARFFNHSTHPNVEAKSGRDFDVALRDISAGEEMTEDFRRFDAREGQFFK